MSGDCVVLASLSPRREELLKKIVPDFLVMGSGYGEPESFSAHEFAIMNAKCKALSCLSGAVSNVILAADTIVVAQGEILNKPKNELEARRMLKKLSNNTHNVITGVCFCINGDIIVDSDESIVEFYEFTDEEIMEYINSGSPFDKAGGYGIQDEFIRRKVKRIEGSVDNIVGLPTELIGRMIDFYKIKL